MRGRWQHLPASEGRIGMLDDLLSLLRLTEGDEAA